MGAGVMFKNLVNNLAVTVPIEASLLQSFLGPKIKELSDVTVTVTEGQLILSGTKKVGVSFFSKDVRFKLTVVPKEALGRKIVFSVVNVEPTDKEMFNAMFLNHDPYISYDARTLTLDLTTMGILQRVKVGNIKSLALEEGRIILIVGA